MYTDKYLKTSDEGAETQPLCWVMCSANLYKWHPSTMFDLEAPIAEKSLKAAKFAKAPRITYSVAHRFNCGSTGHCTLS